MKKKCIISAAVIAGMILILCGCSNNIFDGWFDMNYSGSIAFEPVDEVVYPYIDVVREYLEAGANVDVHDFEYPQEKQAKSIDVSWTLTGAEANGFVLEIATKSDYSDAEKVTLDGDARSYSLKFLLRDTTYYLRITVAGHKSACAETSFKTTYLGPRFLDVGGLYQNCRDLGGYKVGDKTVAYNMVIRGSSPDNCSSADSETLTEEGKTFLNDVVKVKTQIDFRGSAENCGRTTSSFENANYIHVPITAYGEAFSASQAELYAEVFRVFADADNYPVYMHCVGGADRTGTVAAILLAYLGVSEDEIVQDYVVTSFSPVCVGQDARSRASIMTVINGLNTYEGETLSEKARNYLVSIGLTQRELYNIKYIMFGGDVEDYVETKDYGISSANHFYSTADDADLSLKLNSDLKVSGVLADDANAAFAQDGKTVTVKAAGLAKLSDGMHTITIVFDDGTKTPFSLMVNIYDLTGILQVSGIETDGELTYVLVTATANVFTGVDWHFHTRRSTLFPDIEPNIKINGTTIAELNDTTDMSGYTWTKTPGSTDARHRVPANIYASGNTMKLVLRTDWLESYLNGDELSVTICKGFTYTLDGVVYAVSSDITYRYTNNIWVKVV